MFDQYTDADVAAHLVGDDEETAQRFGWCPDRSTETTVRRSFERWASQWRNLGTTSRAPVDPTLGLPPQLTVTKIVGGEGYSIIPDRCVIDVDIRLITASTKRAARELLADDAATVDNHWPITYTNVDFHESMPAYRLHEHAPIRAALQRAAEHHLAADVEAVVAGPSNIGNYLARCGIDARQGLQPTSDLTMKRS